MPNLSTPMWPAAVYPVPESSYTAAVLLFAAASAALPLYLLVFRPTAGQRTWGISEMVAIAVLFLLTLPMAALLVGIDLPLTLVDLSVVTIVQNAVFVGLPAYVAMVRYGLPAASLGVRIAGWPRFVALGAAGAALATPLAIIGEEIAVFLVGLIEGPAQVAARVAAEHLDDPLRPVLAELNSPTAIAWLIVLLAVIVPIGEEMFFRGFVYGGLRSRWGAVRWGAALAALVSAAFFAAVHMQLVHGVPIFLLGLLLALLYERTRSLVPGIITHALTNVIAVLSIWRNWGI